MALEVSSATFTGTGTSQQEQELRSRSGADDDSGEEKVSSELLLESKQVSTARYALDMKQLTRINGFSSVTWLHFIIRAITAVSSLAPVVRMAGRVSD